MATYLFSALSDGQSIAFTPNADVLHFDQSVIAGADLRVGAVGSNVVVTYVATGKQVTLLNVAPNQLAAANFTLTNASLALFGDNSPGTANDAGANVLTGGSGRDLLMGFGGNDTLGGGAESDVLIGGSGNDSIGGGTNGDDWLEGGFGVDRLAGGSGKDSFVFREAGTANADTITDFVTNWDSIQLGGNTLTGLGGNGRFASGDVRFHSGAGVTTAHDADDRIIYNSTTGQLFYDADGIGGSAAQLLANLGAGRALTASDFYVFGTAASGQTINGTEGDDTLTGGAGDDVINGLGGDDWLEGDEGDDSISGGAGDDVFAFWTHDGNDSIDGGSGIDSLNFNDISVALTVDFAAGTVTGAGGNMVFVNVEHAHGGDGNDLLRAGATAVSFWGSFGEDTLIGSGGDDFLDGDYPFFLYDGIGRIHGNNDSIVGGAGNDTIIGWPGDDTLEGGAGADIFRLSGELYDHGNYGNDLIDGGAGTDTIEFLAGDVVFVDLGAGTLIDGVRDETATATLVGIENFILLPGEVSGSRITGSSAANRLSGNGGNDTIDGGAGNDTLVGGGSGSGVGNNLFLFAAAPGIANADQIPDFTPGSDKIGLDASAHANLGAAGNFVAGDARFASNTTGTAQDASDRVIFNTATGELWYDADGSGAGARELIVTIQNARVVTATDIVAVGEQDPSQIVGTEGDETLIGTDGSDTIDALGGNDSLRGWRGSDELNGGAGDDTLDGWIQPDAGDIESVPDTMRGGTGNDEYLVDFAGDVLADEGGVDSVFAWGTDWTLQGGFENLSIRTDGVALTGVGNELDNRMTLNFDGGRLEGRGGNDTLSTSGEAVEFFGGDGNDSLAGSFGNDTLDGGAGDDTLNGSSMFDRLAGGAGSDTFRLITRDVNGSNPTSFDTIIDFASGVDQIQLDAQNANMFQLGTSGRLTTNDPRFYAAPGATGGHDADDRLIYDTSTGDLYFDADGSGAQQASLILVLNSGAGAAALAATDFTVINGTAPSGAVINGTSANDTLSGSAGNDTINGLGGNDLFLAGSTGGADVIDGGAGTDSIEFKARATSSVVVDYGTGSITGGSSGSISFTSVERVVTGNFDDRLTGNAAAQNLTGQGGADTLAGAGGVDTLWGGGGNDVFIFREMGTANADRVSDFTSGGDKLQLDDAAFAAIGAVGNFAAGDARFWASSSGTAHDSNDRVVYNTSTGQLYYDADGNGGGAAQLVATLTTTPAIAATDIAVI